MSVCARSVCGENLETTELLVWCARGNPGLAGGGARALIGQVCQPGHDWAGELCGTLHVAPGHRCYGAL